MRCTLTALFFALFALFSTMAYAAPVPLQGAMPERRCTYSDCRNGSVPPPGSGSTDSATVLKIMAGLLALIGGNNNTPSVDVVVTASPSSSTAPASNPTGTPQLVPTIRWFTEIAIPSPAASGV